MLLSTPGLARYFLHRALLSDDEGWQKWLCKHQASLLKADQKHGLVVQWLKWDAKPAMIERLILAGCHFHQTSSDRDPWTYLSQKIRSQYKTFSRSYYPTSNHLSHFDDSFDQLEMLAKVHPDAKGLNVVSHFLLNHLERGALLGEKTFQHVKLTKRLARVLLLQIETLGPKDAMGLFPALPHILDQSIRAFESPKTSDFEAEPDVQHMFERLRVYHERQQLELAVPAGMERTESTPRRTGARL